MEVYELKTNTVVDALNEFYADLLVAQESTDPYKEADTVVEALNNISVALGGGVHLTAPDAIREIAGIILDKIDLTSGLES